MGLLTRIRKSGPPPVQQDGKPLSVSGRGHVNGFLQLEELNVDLQGRQGLEVFDRMYRTDGDVRQAISMLANPIIAGTWEVEPAGGATATKDAIDDAAFMRWVLFENMSPNLRGHLVELLPGLFRWGFAPFEKVWEVTDYEGQKVTVPRSLMLRLPRTIYRWKQDAYGGLEAIEQYLPVPRAQVISGPNVMLPGDPVLTGPTEDTTAIDDLAVADQSIVTDTRSPDYRQTVWMPTSNLLYYRLGPEGDNWEGVSLLRPAYKHWYMKDALERMDAIAQEKEALGIPVCYPPMGATPDQFQMMEQIMMGIRTNAQGYIIMPGPKSSGSTSGPLAGQGWLIEFLAPGHNGTGRDPHPSLQYHTDKIAATFVAEFIRLGHSLTGGSRNVAESQQDPFLVGVEAITGLVEDVLNAQLVAPVIAYNRPKAKSPPRLKMSLIDATTLSQLADFILKLVQVGAIIPDQILEDFLRARGDLPPGDPDAVAERGDLDDSLRREIIMGKNGNSAQEPAGTNGPAGSTTGGSATGSKGTDNKAKSGAGAEPKPDPGKGSGDPTSAHDAVTRKAIDKATLSAWRGAMSLSAEDSLPPYAPGTERVRWRPQAFYELNVDLDGIEDHFEAAPDRMVDACQLSMYTLARGMAESYPKRTSSNAELQAQMQRSLSDSYDYGAQTVSDEIERHVDGTGYQLSKVARGSVKERAAHGTAHVLDSMHHAIAHAHLAGHQLASKQVAAENAGLRALKDVARSHGVAAFNQGRHDVVLAADQNDALPRFGVRYTAILDKNTCDHCREADDGVVRSLDDPVRVDNQPPNPHCESVASTRGNQCRCFEIPEPLS